MAASPSEPMAFLDGALVPLSRAKVSIFDLGLVQGAGVTEMVRTFAGVPFRLDEHLDRLFRSMHAVGFRIQQVHEELAARVHEVVAHNFRLVPATSCWCDFRLPIVANEFRPYRRRRRALAEPTGG